MLDRTGIDAARFDYPWPRDLSVSSLRFEPFGSEPFGRELRVERLRVEDGRTLWPNGASRWLSQGRETGTCQLPG